MVKKVVPAHPGCGIGTYREQPSLRRRSIPLTERLEQSPAKYLAIFSAVYFVAQICSNLRRCFWIDELITYYMADLPSIGQIWPLIRDGIELNPPLPFWITWIIHHTLGRGEVITRLPAMFGFWLMCVCLFHFVRRRSDVTHGFIAMLLPIFTFSASEATWARGYGVMLGSAAAAVLLWQLAADGIRRLLTLSALALSIAIAVSCHYYALYVAGAIGAGELVRTFERRRPDFGVWSALLLGISPLAVYLSLIRTAYSASDSFWMSPRIRFLYDSYADLFGPAAILLVVWLASAVWVIRGGPENQDLESRQGRSDRPGATLKPHEMVTCLVLAAMPLTVYLAAQVSTVPFYTRYVQPVVIGFSIFAAMFIYRIGGSARFQNMTIWLLVWLGLFPWAITQIAKVFLVPPPAKLAQAKTTILPGSQLPLVIDDENDYLTRYHYASPSVRSRLVYLLDSAAAVKYLGSDTVQRSMRLAQTFHDLHVVDYGAFTALHCEFLVDRTEPRWVLQKLLADGANLQLLSQVKDTGYLVDDALFFHVKMPSCAANH